MVKIIRHNYFKKEYQKIKKKKNDRCVIVIFDMFVLSYNVSIQNMMFD